MGNKSTECAKNKRTGLKQSKKRQSKTKWCETLLDDFKPKKVTKKQKGNRRFQRQTKALCGVIGVNNALGWRLLTREDVDKWVRELGKGGDAQGNYSPEVIHLALQKKGYRLRKQKNKQHMWLAKQKAGQFLCLGWHLSYDNPAHYIGVDADKGFVLDGAFKNVAFKLDVSGILKCLSYGLANIWKIEKIPQ
jgi:hypothetical protein